MSQSILIVDDEPQILISLQQVLRPIENNLMAIWTRDSAEEAMELMDTEQIDVVITDENMPGKSGIELLSWISDNAPTTKKVLLTGDQSLSTAIRAINQGGVDAYLTKPFKQAELLGIINKLLLPKNPRSRNQPFRELHEQALAVSQY